MKMIHSSKIQPEVKTLLSYATSEKKVDREYPLYIENPERVLYGYTIEQDLVGFHITSLGEKYPGVERFGCLLTCTT